MNSQTILKELRKLSKTVLPGIKIRLRDKADIIDEAIRWWWSWQIAEQMLEDFRVKDLAESINDGTLPRFLTIEDTIEDIQKYVEEDTELWELVKKQFTSFYKD